MLLSRISGDPTVGGLRGEKEKRSTSVRESVRTRDMSWSRRHSSRIMHLLECVLILEHCTALRW